MPCYHPITGYRAILPNKDTGKYSVVFDYRKGYNDLKITVPCGRCIGCRLDRSRQWAVRCVHEASLYSDNCFITLTFSDEFLKTRPASGLIKRDFQLFMKRLRRKFPDRSIRYFHCGEYGSEFGRPHHHACIFNFDFPDKRPWSVKEGVQLYRSAILESLWSDPVDGRSFGFCTVGSVTFESAAYVARYVMKKITGDPAEAHYQGREPEYITMSRRPGIGKGWYDKYTDDLFPNDFVVVRGVKCRVPKYYNKCYDLTNPGLYGKISLKRQKDAVLREDSHPRKFRTLEVIKEAQVSRLVRPL